MEGTWQAGGTEGRSTRGKVCTAGTGGGGVVGYMVSPKINVCLETQNVILFRNGVSTCNY